MDDRFNTAAGWTLFAGIVALGLSSISGKYFGADKVHRPHEMGYAIAGVEAEGGKASGPSLNTLLAGSDVAKGEKVFAKCMSCHSINSGGANGIGPNLFGVVGKPIGKHAAGFAYSGDLAGHGGDWTFENLNHWLTSPRAFAAGTKMTFAGLSDAADRANLIAYLNSQGSNLPLPAADAPAAEGGAAAAPTVDSLVASADPVKGEKSFAKCTSCHSVTQGGANGIGPNLYGVLGESIGAGRGGFAFSDALAKHGGKWDFTSMDAWLTSPRAFASGTKMTFAGLSDPVERANVIAYLNKQGSNLPVAAAAAPAAK